MNKSPIVIKSTNKYCKIKQITEYKFFFFFFLQGTIIKVFIFPFVV